MQLVTLPLIIHPLPQGVNGKCSTPVNATRYFATNYQYVGGYYGGCSEEAMRISLVRNGPLVVSFMVSVLSVWFLPLTCQAGFD